MNCIARPFKQNYKNGVKQIILCLANKMGLTIERISTRHADTSFIKRYSISITRPEINYGDLIAKDPLNATLHLQYAAGALKNNKAYLAYAELKTAEYLGATRADVSKG